MLIFLPTSLIYLLYHPLVELAMRGRTPGKRMAGVRIVNRQGGTPSSLAILIRNGFRLIDCLPVSVRRRAEHHDFQCPAVAVRGHGSRYAPGP